MGKVSESIFEGSSITIPMADVQHYEKHWYAGDDREINNYRGILIITKHTTWNFDHDTWDNAIYLAREDADKFRRSFNEYRAGIESETLNVGPYNDSKPIYFRCKCGEEIEGNKNTDEHQIICPKCKRTGCVELLPE